MGGIGGIGGSVAVRDSGRWPPRSRWGGRRTLHAVPTARREARRSIPAAESLDDRVFRRGRTPAIEHPDDRVFRRRRLCGGVLRRAGIPMIGHSDDGAPVEEHLGERASRWPSVAATPPPPARTYSRRWNTARRPCARAASSVVARSFDAGRCGSGTAVASWRECMCAACAAPVDAARAIDSDQRRLTGAAYATGHSAGLHIRLPCAPHRTAPHRAAPCRAVPCRTVPCRAALRCAARSRRRIGAGRRPPGHAFVRSHARRGAR